MYNKIMSGLLWWLVGLFPNRSRTIWRDGEEYLTRFYLTSPRTSQDSSDEKSEGFGMYLHYFHTPDLDEDLHNHPWDRALSFILCGGYVEERFGPDGEITVHKRRPGTFNYIDSEMFHRVDSVPEGKQVWTLFMTGNRMKRWGFKMRYTREYYDWEEYLVMKGERVVK